MDTSIYRQIAERTGGDVYIGVVGPVRCGKSTFIKRFMETTVIPNIEGEFERERAKDALPQSAGGKTVMTTEPKFIPDEGVTISLRDGTKWQVKLVDCVGYMIPQALGNEENGSTRMVQTPWHDAPVPFEEAAEFGTRKVITDHATIGMLVTTDGSFGEFSRESYVDVEERVVGELKGMGKPFCVILNSAQPESEGAVKLAVSLEEKYSAPVALVNCRELDSGDVEGILTMLLEEFPAKEARVEFPSWTAVLDEDNPLRSSFREAVVTASSSLKKLRDGREGFLDTLSSGITKAVQAKGEYAEPPATILRECVPGEGRLCFEVKLPDGLYYDVLSEITGMDIQNESQLLKTLADLSMMKGEFDQYREAINMVNEKGYGIVMPQKDSLKMEKPQIIRQAGGYGVRLKASAPSVHMIRTNIETEINPIVGTEQQSEEMSKFLAGQIEEDAATIWESNMFGRSLYELMEDGLSAKLANLPEEARQKFGETLSRIINEGSQGLICIIL